MPSATARIGVIGYGAIADEMIRCLEIRGRITSLVGVLDLPEKLPELQTKAAGRFPVVAAVPQLLDLQPQIIIEAAGHSAVYRFGADILRHGCDLLIASTGTLADPKLADALVTAAPPATEIWIASGAVAGIDGLIAARTAGLQSVTYTSLKA